MADEKETVEKVYDIDKGWIDKPANIDFANPDFAPKKPGTEPPPTPTPPVTDPPVDDKDKTPPVEDKDKNPPVEKPKDPPKTDPPPTTTFDKAKFEKYGIEKEEDIISTLDSVDSLMKENEELRKRPTEIQHKSETHKKLFNFLEQYPENTWNEVLKTGGEILSMNPDEADGVKVLREAFILSHPMLSREEAALVFEDEHTSKYTLKPKEEYEDPAKYERDKKLQETRMKIEIDKSRQILREAKAKLTVEQKPATTPAKFEIPAETINNYSKEVNKVLDGTTKGSGLAYIDKNTIMVRADEKADPVIKIVLPAEKIKELTDTMTAHIKNPGVYDKSGKIPNFDASKSTLAVAFALWPEWISQQMASQVDTLASIKKAEQIAQTNPDKIETTQGKDIKTMSVDEQLRELAKREKEKRERGQQPRAY